jgi:hypothetical protein
MGGLGLSASAMWMVALRDLSDKEVIEGRGVFCG